MSCTFNWTWCLALLKNMASGCKKVGKSLFGGERSAYSCPGSGFLAGSLILAFFQLWYTMERCILGEFWPHWVRLSSSAACPGFEFCILVCVSERWQLPFFKYVEIWMFCCLCVQLTLDCGIRWWECWWPRLVVALEIPGELCMGGGFLPHKNTQLQGECTNYWVFLRALCFSARSLLSFPFNCCKLLMGSLCKSSTYEVLPLPLSVWAQGRADRNG